MMTTNLRRYLLLSALAFFSFAGSAGERSYDDVDRVVSASDMIIRNRGQVSDIDSLLSTLPSLAIGDAAVDSIISLPDANVTKIIDAIYLINNLKNGIAFDEARDAVSFTMSLPFRNINDNDLRKLNDVFSSGNPVLHRAYLKKFAFMFRSNGPLPGLMDLRRIIDENVADCKEKTDAVGVYEHYGRVASGCPAPKVDFIDESGNSRSFDDYLGKTIIVDVWATWCHNCLKKMPKMNELRDSFSSDDRVVFLTVSIDRREDDPLWREYSSKYSIEGNNNLMAGRGDEKSEFENLYCIDGVPRYIVIDRYGKIVSSHAPSPGEELKKMIEATL